MTQTGYLARTYPVAPGDRNAIILASGSATRAKLLRAAGIPFSAEPPDLDEPALRRGVTKASDAAQVLADRKALAISALHPHAWVIGSDQILAFGPHMLGKPGTRANARAQLLQLRGARHALVTAVSLARSGRVLWHHVEQADLTMRPLSEIAIDRYLDQAGADVIGSPGAYHLEGLGATLFQEVRGDFFAILGLPLLPLLQALRHHGALTD
jgi:septum formation protein